MNARHPCANRMSPDLLCYKCVSLSATGFALFTSARIEVNFIISIQSFLLNLIHYHFPILRSYYQVFTPHSDQNDSAYKSFHCNDTCDSAHRDHIRGHLPAVLMRATHGGNANGSIPANHGPDSNGDIWPRYRGQRPIERWEVKSHGEIKSSCSTQFSSFTPWRGLAYWIRN